MKLNIWHKGTQSKKKPMHKQGGRNSKLDLKASSINLKKRLA